MPRMKSPQTSSKVSQSPMKVLIADDHSIFRHGLKTLLTKYSFVHFKGEASNGSELQKMVDSAQPDLIFMDLHMPGGHGIETTEAILKKYPRIKIVILSFYDDALTVKKMMTLGASAYLTKNISLEILDAMFEQVRNNHTYVSPDAITNMAQHKILPGPSPTLTEQDQWLLEEITLREKQVLKLIVKGFSQKEIAGELSLSPKTIETHKEKLMKRLGAKNQAELISMAYKYKLL